MSVEVYVGFSLPANRFDWLARLITFVTRGDVDHSFLVLRLPPFSDYWTLGCGANGLVFLKLSQFRQDTIVKYMFRNDKLISGLLRYQERIGEGYDWLGLLGMGWVEAMSHFFGRWVKNPFTAKKRIFCSAYVAMVAQVEYPQLLEGRFFNTIDPTALKDWMIVEPDFIRCDPGRFKLRKI